MTAATWLVSAMDVMWRSALTVIPPTLLVAAICRWGGCRPATRHLLWFVVLLLPFAIPLLSGSRTADSVPQPASLRTETAPVEPPLPTLDVVEAPQTELPNSPPPPHEVAAKRFTHRIAPPTLRTERELTDVRAGTTGPLVLARGSGPAERPSHPRQPAEPSADLCPAGVSVDDAPTLSLAQSLDAAPASDSETLVALASMRLALLNGLRNAADLSAAGLRWLQRIMPPAPIRVWLAGGAMLLILHTIGLLRFRGMARRAKPADSNTSAMVRAAASALGLRRAPSAWLSVDRVSPMVGGLFAPRLILPSALWSQLDESGCRAILLHELAHLARRDHWVRAIDAVVTAVFWWHPAAWWARRRVRDEAEICCDAWVTWLLPRGRRAYATALLKTQAFVGNRPARGSMAGIGVVSVRASRLARRLTMVMSDSGKPRISLIGLALALVPVLVAWLAVPVLSCPPQETPQPSIPGAETPASVAPPAGLLPSGLTPAPMAGSYQNYIQTHTPQPLPQMVSNLYSQLVGSTLVTAQQPRPRAGGDRNDLEARLDRLERQLDALSRRLESMGAAPGPTPPVAVARRGRSPAAMAPSPDEPVVGKFYRLSGGKLEPLTKLMIREDVPIKVRPTDDGIEIFATPGQHEALAGFIAIIDPSQAGGVIVAPRARSAVRTGIPRSWAIAPGAPMPEFKAQAKATKAAAKALEIQRKVLEKQAEKLREQSEKLKERADELKSNKRSDSGAQIQEMLAKAEAADREAEAREQKLAAIESQLDAVSDASEAIESTTGEDKDDENSNGEDVTADLRAKAESNEKDGSTWFKLGFALHSEGKYDEARKAFEQAAELDFNKMQSIYNIACGYARAGNADQAMVYLQKAWDAGFIDAKQYKNDADLESLRDDPRFQALIGGEHTAP